MRQQGIAGGFLLIILALAILAIAAGTYYLGVISTQQKTSKVSQQVQPTPIPDPTTSWNTYTNNKYEYSVRYPDFITLKTAGDDVIFYYKKDEDESEAITNNELPTYYTKGLHFYFRSGSPTEAASLEMPSRPVQQVEINNSKGVKITDLDFDYYLAPKTGNSPTIRIGYLALKGFQTEEGIKERVNTYGQILSTFKFTPQ